MKKFRVGETGVDEMGVGKMGQIIGKTEVGKTGVGKMEVIHFHTHLCINLHEKSHFCAFFSISDM